MQLNRLLLPLNFCIAALWFVGCSTPSSRIGSGDRQLAVGKHYELRREALLLANRGLIDSIENPDYSITNYHAGKDFDSYSVKPKGVLPKGTVIKVTAIRFYGTNQFRVTGEIVSGQFGRKPYGTYDVMKVVTIGGELPTGEVVINKLCGGCTFDPDEFARNLAPR